MNGLSDLDAARASFAAVEGGAAAPHAFFVVQNLETLGTSAVAAVENESVSIDDCSWTKVRAICPEHWAGGGAGSTQDALGGVIESGAILGALQTFLGGFVF